MGKDTKIEWARHSWNPWVGCTKVSPACDHCYAEGWAKRAGNPELWNGERRRTSTANWRQPIKWDVAAAAAGERHRVFCASLADVFDNQADPEWRHALWSLIFATPNLDWLLLTKRPQNIRKMLPADWGGGWPNVWLGTTVENQEEANRRIPHLLSVPARIRFLSCEPLLGPLDLDTIVLRHHGQKPNELSSRLGDYVRPLSGNFTDSPKIHWVIAGGESGAGARPMHPAWVRSLRDACARAGAAFFFKQWGAFRPVHWSERRQRGDMGTADLGWPDDPTILMRREGKAKAGRELEGQLHDAVPA